MQVASRPRFAAGVALVGASVVVASTVSPVRDIHLPDIHLPALRTAEINLAAATYAEVFQEAAANAQALLTTFKANPTPILSQIAQNQVTTLENLMAGLQTTGGAISTALTTTVPPLLQAARTDLVSGNVEGAINNVLGATLAVAFPITGFVPTLSAAFTQPLTNLVNAVNAVQAGGVLSPLSLAVIGLLGPALSGAGAFGVAVDNVGAAIPEGPAAVVHAIANGPALILDGVLNGGYGPNLAALAGLPPDLITVVAGGLLSGTLHASPAGALVLPGTINSLQALGQAIATAITPKATATADVKSSTPASPAALPAAAAKAITLKIGSTAAAIRAKAAETPAEKDSSGSSTSTPETSTVGAESTGTTNDSTSKSDSTNASTVKTPADKGNDVTTGNKTEPGCTAGSDAPNSGDTGSAASHETATGHAGTTKSSSNGAAKGAGNGAHAASHGRHAK
jgi:hypothetical protein